MIERMDDALWDVVEDVIREHPVLFNRAPTLHRLGIRHLNLKLLRGVPSVYIPLLLQHSMPILMGTKWRLRFPLSQEAPSQARLLMLAANNILNPKDGQPVVTPSQDMVLGNIT